MANRTSRLLLAAVLAMASASAASPALAAEPANLYQRTTINGQDNEPRSAAGTSWGVDVSGWQHPYDASIDWNAASSSYGGMKFAYVKTSEGTDASAYGPGDIAGASGAGLAVGAYHYATPSTPIDDDASAEARAAVAAATAAGWSSEPGNLPIALDLESNPNALSADDLAAWALRWLEEVQDATGTTPAVYTYPSFFADNVAPNPAFSNYPLWIAQYGAEIESPEVPLPWVRWTLWQHSAAGAVTGIEENVDLNVFAGTSAEFDLFSGHRSKAERVRAPITASEAFLDSLYAAPTTRSAGSQPTIS